jgi:precorrin-2 dehydrogenase/sirohydrochlorin ferrochelatase
MAYYPLNLRLDGRMCLVLGGGEVAERKALSLLAAGAAVTVRSPRLTPPLVELAEAGRIQHINTPYQSGAIENYFIVICATDDRAVNSSAATEARRAGALVNVVDAPELCDFTVPAHIARGDLVITVSTNGKSPALSRRLRQELEQRYGPEYGLYLELVSRLRADLKGRLPAAGERLAFWREALDEEIIALLRAGKITEAEEKIRNAAGGVGTQP